MRTFLSTTQDATIYERYPTLNTGLDEIIEVGKIIKSLDGPNQYTSGSTRMLITTISNILKILFKFTNC